jgi:N-acetylglucosaminyl-diphospho-decaprenol L-rhamnosyltransferase
MPPFGWGLGVVAPLSARILGGHSSASTPEPIAWARGALLFLRTTMLEAIGAFDERFFMYFEETDLCRRALDAGWSIWSVPLTSYEHELGGSTSLRTDRDRLYADSGYAYFRKHHGRVAAVVFRLQHRLIRQWCLPLRRRLGRVTRHLRPLTGDRVSTQGEVI